MSPWPREVEVAEEVWVEGTSWDARESMVEPVVLVWEVLLSGLVLEAGLEDWFRPVCWEGWEGALGSMMGEIGWWMRLGGCCRCARRCLVVERELVEKGWASRR